MKGSLDAGVVAGEPVELILEFVVGHEVVVGRASAEFGFHTADPVKVPGGGHQLIEQGLLDGALGFDVGLVIGEQIVELFLFAGGDDDLAGGESMFRCILRGAVFSFGGAGSGGMLRVGGIGRELSGGSGHDWVSGV